MRPLYVPLLLSITLGANLPLAQADTLARNSGSIAVKMTPSEIKAAAEIKKMFGARDAIKACHVEYSHTVKPRDGSQPYTVVVSGELQKPNKMSLQLSSGSTLMGQVVSDGVTETFYEPQENIYAQCPAAESYDVRSQWPFGAEPQKNVQPPPISPQQREELMSEAIFGSDRLIYMKDILAGARFLLRTTSQAEIDEVSGRPYVSKLKITKTVPGVLPLDIVYVGRPFGEEVMTSFFQFKIDPAGDLPNSFHISIGVVAPNHEELKDTATNGFDDMKIKPATDIFPAETFTWEPPARARLKARIHGNGSRLQTIEAPR